MKEKTAASPVAQDVAKAKYYKRRQREYYQVTDKRVIRVINRYYVSDVSITHEGDEKGNAMGIDFIRSAAQEGEEITRAEFAEQFAIASKLIVLDPV